MPDRLETDTALLDGLLREVVRATDGPETEARFARMLRRCEEAYRADPDEALGHREALLGEIAAMDLGAVYELLLVSTLRFHLMNKAEQLHIARVNRERERAATPERPRAESIADAVWRLKRAGCSLAGVAAIVERMDVQPTLTAHPTEARRRAVLRKQQAIAEVLGRGDRQSRTPVEERRDRERLLEVLEVMFRTDEVRQTRLHVLEEVRNGIYFLAGSIWDAVPRLHRDLREALADAYPGEEGGAAPDAAFLRYRSWIGGDRDGNPNVTPEVTRSTLAMLRETAIGLHLDSLERLRGELSVSDRQARVPPELLGAVERRGFGGIAEEDRRHLVHEPLRLFLLQSMARLRAAARGEGGYGAADLVEDLRLLQRALEGAGLRHAARSGAVADALVRARAFGLCLATLDVRQHSGVHEEAVAELLRRAQACGDYLSLAEEERAALLTRELSTPRPLLPPGAALSPETARVLEVFRVVREAVARDPESVKSYVISMTHGASDVLEVLVLMKEAGLCALAEEADGAARSALDVAPLFETVDDLRRAPALLREMFANPVYRRQLAARGGLQEIMLGYSDSNKDGGYWAANWSLHEAEGAIGDACRAAGVDFRLFHGRGGSIGRGGGRANRAILATPRSSRSGRVRMTEQGEVITFRYALPELARRHLEQVVGAVMLSLGPDAAAGGREGGDGGGGGCVLEPDEACVRLMRGVSERSMERYRSLVHHPAFWGWYTEVSPVRHISRLKIASRPVARTGGAVGLENIRAIPWVFAWTQMRYTAPGWFGIGAGLGWALSEGPGEEELRRLYRAWPFFTGLINNAQQEMARARLPIGRLYARAGDPEPDRMLREEFEAARTAVLRVTGQKELLEQNPVILASIRRRNPATDLLNLVQIDLLRRAREHGEGDLPERLAESISLSISGIAAAMQSTG